MVIVRHPKCKPLKLDRIYNKPSAISVDNVWLGAEYTEEQIEFLKAMEKYMKEKHRRFPAFTEVLNVVKSLGYRRTTADVPTIVY